MALIVTPRQLKRTSEFYRELASLMGAGIPAVQALQTIHRAPPGRHFRAPVARAIASIQAGSGFTDGLMGDARWLPPFDEALLRAGEISGRLVESFRSMAEHYENRARLLDQLILKLLYPAFLFHLAVLVFPPSLIAGLVWRGEVATFLFQKLSVLLPTYLVVLAVILGLQSERHSGWRTVLEAVLGAVPVLGAARTELSMARLSAALEALVSAGVGIIEAWDMASRASGSPAIVRRVQSWLGPMHSGELPSELVRQSPEFTEMFANLYATGETSGQLDQELRHLRDYYQESGLRKMNLFVLGVVVLVSLSVMIAVGFFIIRFYVGYFDQLFNAVGP